MWILLTSGDGQPVSFNSHHMIRLQNLGDRTLVVHTRGETLVLESQTAILAALGLKPMRENPAVFPRIELDS